MSVVAVNVWQSGGGESLPVRLGEDEGRRAALCQEVADRFGLDRRQAATVPENEGRRMRTGAS